MKKILSLLLTFLLSFSLFACSDIDLALEDMGIKDANKADNIKASIAEDTLNADDTETTEETTDTKNLGVIKEDERYTSKEDVSLYLNTYDKLPSNYIKKKEAMALGWESSKGNLWDVTDEMSIGGDYFGNKEKRLPVKSGRKYSECDINYNGKYRGPERLVYSNDGLIYYTGNHYDSFTLLYGEE